MLKKRGKLILCHLIIFPSICLMTKKKFSHCFFFLIYDHNNRLGRYTLWKWKWMLSYKYQQTRREFIKQ